MSIVPRRPFDNGRRLDVELMPTLSYRAYNIRRITSLSIKSIPTQPNCNTGVTITVTDD